jgi:hypothetical protein
MMLRFSREEKKATRDRRAMMHLVMGWMVMSGLGPALLRTLNYLFVV